MRRRQARREFVPVTDQTLAEAKSWGEGPFCECDDAACRTVLPAAAWAYVAGRLSQFVVAPGHERPGARLVELEGFNVEEGDA